jgi:molybdopterin molybdotransferase
MESIAMPETKKMISLDPARRIVAATLENVKVPTETISVRQAAGRVLAADQLSALDIPPFNKSAMDGYAIPAGDDGDEYRVLETVAAGDVPRQKLTTATAVKIMTGAPVPEGTAKVVMIEKTTEANGRVRIVTPDLASHICYKGEDMRCGDVVVAAGAVVGPADIGNLISVGVTNVKVARRVRVGIISTGNEIVDCPDELAAGKIMNANGPMLTALCHTYGLDVVSEQIVPDELDKTVTVLREMMAKSDIVVLSGGVSVGQFDFVAEAMKQAGLTIHFDRLAVKPGKPMTFAASDDGKAVMGLPGNPVAVYLMFHLFVLYAASVVSGRKTEPAFTTLPLGFDFNRRKADRTAFIPCRLTTKGSVEKIDYHGTAHLMALSNSDGFFVVPTSVTQLSAGETVDFISFKRGFGC